MGFEAKFGKSRPSYEQFTAYIRDEELKTEDYPRIIAYIRSLNRDEVITSVEALQQRRWSASAPQGIHNLVKEISGLVANTLITDFSELMRLYPLLAAEANVLRFIQLSKSGIDRDLQRRVAVICAKDAPRIFCGYCNQFPDLSIPDIISVLTTCVNTDPTLIIDSEFVATVSEKIPKKNWTGFIDQCSDAISENIEIIFERYTDSTYSGRSCPPCPLEPGSFMYEWISDYVKREPDILFSAILRRSYLWKGFPIANDWLRQCLMNGRDQEKMVGQWVNWCLFKFREYKFSTDYNCFENQANLSCVSTLVSLLQGLQNPKISRLVLGECAKKMPDYLTEHILEFGLENQQMLEELAKLCAKNAPSSLSKHIAKFRIQSQECLEELALCCLEADPSSLCASIEQFAIKSPSIRKEIAQRAAAIDPIVLAKEIDHFQLEESLRFSLAKLCLEQDGYLDEAFLTHYSQFQLEQLPFRLECAKMMLRLFSSRAIDLVGEVFKDLANSGQMNEAFDLAKEAIIHARGAAIRQISNWFYPNEFQQFRNPQSPSCLSLDQRTALAELGSEIDGRLTASQIDIFGITDSQVKFSILSKCVQTDPLAMPYTISLMDWTGWINLFVEALKQIREPAEIVAPILAAADQWQVTSSCRSAIIAECVRYCPVLVAKNVDALKLPNERKFELLQQAVRECPVQTVATFGDLHQFTREQRLGLIEGCFKKDPHTTINLPELFSDCDQETVFSFLFRYAETPCACFPTLILEFCENQEILKEDSLDLLAKQFAANMPSEFLLNLRLFSVNDPEKMARVLQICFGRDPKSIWKFFDGFSQDVLSDDQVISLALEWARTAQSGIAFNFQNLRIPKENQEKILEIALVCAAHDGEETARSFANFQLEGQQARVEVVRVIASSAPQSLAPLISLENVASEEERYSLAQIAARSSPKALREFDHWGIEQQQWIDHLIEIFEKAFPADFQRECVYIIKPRVIPSLERRKLLAELACEYNPCEAANAFVHFDIPNKWDQIGLVVLMAQHTDQLANTSLNLEGISLSGEETQELERLFELTQSDFSLDGLGQIALADPKSSDFSLLVKKELFSATCSILKRTVSGKALSIFQDHCYPSIRTFLLSHRNVIDPTELPANGKELSLPKLKKFAIAYIGLQVFRESQLSHPLFDQVFKKLINLRNGHQAIQYLGIMAYKTTDLFLEALAIGVQSSKKKSNQPYGEPLAPLLIPMLMVAKWAGECGNLQLVQRLNETFRRPSVIKQYFKKEATQAHSLMQVWLSTVAQLERAQEISPLRKLKLLTQAATGLQGIPGLINCLSYIQAILADEPRQLDNEFDKSIEDDLIRLVTEGALKDDTLRLREVEDIERKYVETLMRLRVPNAWRVFSQQLKETKDGRLLEHYRDFLVSVLNGTFKDDRYKTTSPHIDKIRYRYEKLWQMWKEGTSSQEVQLRSDEDERFSFSFFVKKKIRDSHFSYSNGERLFPQLSDWAIGNIPANEVIEKLQQEENPLAKIEERIMRLCIDESLSLEVLQRELLEIVGALRGQVKQPVECVNDFESLAETLINPTSSETFKIVNTDNWQDLLLSGTEVVGSCQRVGGNYWLNRGLVGYLIDGKIRMIVIINPETGAIEGRAVLRILVNETTGLPVLFLDRKYLNKHRVSMSRAIDQYAQEVAGFLGCPLYTADPVPGKMATKDRIVSLGSVSGCEYSDDAGGVTDGRYTLRSAYRVV